MVADAGILFVLGAARSGTTYLNFLLEEWFDYGMGPEGSFVAEFARRLPRYGNLEEDRNLSHLLDEVSRCETLEIARHSYAEDLRFDVSPALLRSRLRERSFAGVVYAVFECMALLQGRSRVGNKYPAYWRQLPLLHRLFPGEAKYLCIVRDGRDVALSTMRMKWGERSSYACARHWVKCLESVDRFARGIGGDRLLVIRYEDVLGEPAATVERLERFVGVDLRPERRAAMIASMRDGPLRGNSGKWRRLMSERDLRLYEAVAGRWLRRFGYETVNAAARASWAEAIWYNGSEVVRRARRTIATSSRGVGQHG